MLVRVRREVDGGGVDTLVLLCGYVPLIVEIRGTSEALHTSKHVQKSSERQVPIA